MYNAVIMKKSQNPWKKLSSKIVYKTPWVTVQEDKVIKPDGKRGIYSIVRTPAPAVFIVPMTDKKEIYLVRLFRYPTRRFSWEVPAGNTDNENPLKAARRELWEETGLRAKSFRKLGTFQSMNGIFAEKGYIYLATRLSQTGKNKRKEEGINEVKRVPLKRVLQMIRTGKITDDQSITSIMHTLLFLGMVNPS